MKKIVSIILVLVIILGCVPVYAANIKNTITIPSSDKSRMNSEEAEIYMTSFENFMAGVHPGMSDLQLILYAHDWIACNVVYDHYSQYLREMGYSVDYRIHTAVGALVDYECVCDGYSSAFKLFMDQCGIPCEIVRSGPMDHAWNIVKLDGNWYHIDVTNDAGALGFVSRYFFLLSDEEMKACGFHDWSAKYKCTSTKYDDHMWDNNIPAYFFTDSDTYYAQDLLNNTIYKYSWSTGEKTAVESFEYLCNSAMICYSDTLFFIADDAIWALNPKNDGINLLATKRDMLLGSFAFTSQEQMQEFIANADIEMYYMVLRGNSLFIMVEGNRYLDYETFPIFIVDPHPVVIMPGITNPFEDVDENDVFFESVMWALENNVTKGTSSTTFSPYDTCTRGQTVTFLWRAAGCPEPTTKKNPFADIKESDYYYKPILWAVEKGITNGTSKTTFSPEEICSTAHIVTFIWRALNQNWVNTGANWWDSAFAWANGKKMLELNITVTPSDPSPRCDVVSMLWLYAQDNN